MIDDCEHGSREQGYSSDGSSGPHGSVVAAMTDAGKSVMIGIRHRCGQIMQFWIPASWVLPVLERSLSLQTEDLGSWMAAKGWLPDEEADRPHDLVEHLKEQLAPRGVAFIDVQQDESVCPGCSELVPWVDVVADLAGSGPGE